MKKNNYLTIGNIIIVILVIIIGLWLFTIAAIDTTNNTNEITTESIYAMTTKVVDIDKESDIVTVKDSTGNLWEFYGVEDWEIGDCASMVMNNMGTDSIYDDEIISAQYAAWTLTE